VGGGRAEIRHATDDFWQCVHAHGAGLLFDHHKRVEEARPFRFQHEVHAIEAWDWLGALNTHEGWKTGPWALWMHWNERQRADWRVRWFSLARGFLRRMRAYEAARAALAEPNSRRPAPGLVGCFTTELHRGLLDAPLFQPD